VGLQQFDETAREHGQVYTALGGEGEELRGARGGVVQPVDRAVCAAGALVIDQGLDVGGLFDLLTPIEAARMDGEHRGTVDDPHGVDAGEDFEDAAHVGVRDRVII
jgi:hypothetical protein